MPDRTSALSSGAVGLAIVGSVMGDQLLSLLGPILALLIHVWTESREKRNGEAFDQMSKRLDELEHRVTARERPTEADLAWLRDGEWLPARTGPHALATDDAPAGDCSGDQPGAGVRPDSARQGSQALLQQRGLAKDQSTEVGG